MTDKKLAWVFTQSDEETTTFAGGTPFMDPTESWPQGEDGLDYRFLFQVDLSKVDDIGLNLPSDGFLQFFTHADDLFGMNMDDPDDYSKDNRTLVRHVTNAVDVSDVNAPENVEDETPLNDATVRVYYEGHLVESVTDENGVSGSNVDNDSVNEVNENGVPVVADLTDYEFYLGGHPLFAQDDFRGNSSDIVLLAGSSSNRNVNWGDMGFASFWIDPNSAKDREYGASFLYWDCF